MLGALLRWFLYSVWFVLALVASLYYSIPKDDIRRFAQSRASERLKTPVTISKLQLHGITGVELLGVKVVLPIKKPDAPAGTPSQPGAPGGMARPPAGGGDETGEADATNSDRPSPGSSDTGGNAGNPAAGGAAKPEEGAQNKIAAGDIPGLLIADSVRVDVNTFGLLMGQKLKAKLTAAISGGTIEDTSLTMTQDGWSLVVGAMTGINLGPIKPFRTLAKMDLDLLARLSGHAEFEWGGRLQDSRGKLELQLADTVLPYLPLKDPRQPFPIGEAFEVQLGTIEVRASLDRADKLTGVRPRPGNPVTLLLEKLSAKGEHLELQLDSGQKHTIAFVGKSGGDAEVDITFVLSFTDAFFQWKGVGHRPDGEEVADASHAGLEMGLQAGLKSARTVIGSRAYYGFHCVGPLKTFKCLPKAPSRRLVPMADPGGNTGTGGGEVEANMRPAAPMPMPSDETRAGGVERPIPSRPVRPIQATPPSQTGRVIGGTGRPPPRLVDPTRPTDERFDSARRFGLTGQPGDTLGPGVGGGLPVPPNEPMAEPLPNEPEPTAAELVPEPAPGEAHGELPAEGAEGHPGEPGAVDGVEGALPAEGGEVPLEPGSEQPE
jgi:hypothetical protein